MSKFYVYELIDPRDQKVFYIGKGSFKRMYDHVNAVKNHKIPNSKNILLYNKINELLQLNIQPKYNKIFETDDENAAYEFEIQKIHSIGLTNLCNLCSRNFHQKSGFNISEKHRLRISAANKGKQRTPEQKHRISEATKAAYQRPEVRQHNIDGHIGLKQTQKQIDKRNESITGMKFPGRGLRIWESRRLNGTDKMSDETRKKIALKSKNRLASDETKAKMSATHKRKLSQDKDLLQKHLRNFSWYNSKVSQ